MNGFRYIQWINNLYLHFFELHGLLYLSLDIDDQEKKSVSLKRFGVYEWNKLVYFIVTICK